MNRKYNDHSLISARQIIAAMLLLMLLAGYFVTMNISARADGGDSFSDYGSGTQLDTLDLYSDVATPSDIPRATTKPSEPAPEYDIKIKPPAAWSNANSVQVKVLIEDVRGSGWSKIEVRIGSADWVDMSKQYLEEKILLLELAENGRLTVRITDKQGGYHSESSEIKCIDREPPTLTASVDGGRLHVATSDDLSGVAGIRVNGYLFANLQNGVLDMSMEELLSRSEKLEIQAFDYAGNTSASVILENPYFTTPTPKPTAAPTSVATATTKPSSGSATKKKATATPKVTETPTPEPTATMPPLPTATLLPSVSYMPYPYQTVTPSVSEGTAFTGQGNMKTLDLLYSANTNKQFISVQTKNGETFYLIIDYDKPIDEDGDLYETYFLNLVDARDLFDVVSEDDLPSATPVIITVTPEPTVVAVTVAPTIEAPGTSVNNGDSTLPLLAFIGIGGVGAGAFVYFRKKREKESDFADDFEEDTADYDEAE